MKFLLLLSTASPGHNNIAVMTYFQNIHSLADLKREYRHLAMQNHPDKGGDTAIMQQVNTEFERLFEVWKDKTDISVASMSSSLKSSSSCNSRRCRSSESRCSCASVPLQLHELQIRLIMSFCILFFVVRVIFVIDFPFPVIVQTIPPAIGSTVF